MITSVDIPELLLSIFKKIGRLERSDLLKKVH